MKKLQITATILVILATLTVAYKNNARGQTSGSSVLKGYYPMAAFATGSTGNLKALSADASGNLAIAAGAGFGMAPTSLKGFYPAVLYGINGGNPIALQADSSGSLLMSTAAGGPVNGTTYSTATACNNGSSPAVCGSAAAGLILMPAGQATLQVLTTAVKANSQIFYTFTNTCGALPTNYATLGNPYTNGISAGVSFNVTLPVTPATNFICMQYLIFN